MHLHKWVQLGAAAWICPAVGSLADGCSNSCSTPRLHAAHRLLLPRPPCLRLPAEAPAQILDSLPLIANNLAMVRGIVRHYAQPAALAAFLRRIANQLIKRSRLHILAGGKLWEQDRPALIAALGDACRLHAAFLEHAGRLLAPRQGSSSSGPAGSGSSGIKPAVPAAAGAAAAVASEAAEAALAKYGLFAKRCAKLAEMFGTVDQFAALAANTHIEGVSSVLAQFMEVRLRCIGLLLSSCWWGVAARCLLSCVCSPTAWGPSCLAERVLVISCSPTALPSPTPSTLPAAHGRHEEAAVRPAGLRAHAV